VSSASRFLFAATSHRCATRIAKSASTAVSAIEIARAKRTIFEADIASFLKTSQASSICLISAINQHPPAALRFSHNKIPFGSTTPSGGEYVPHRRRFLVSVAGSLAQGLQPAVWQGQRGSVLKVLTVDPTTGNFAGVFLSSPVGPCPAVPYDAVGRIQGPRVVFQTSRNWTSDCRVTTVGSGRFVSPTTVVTRWIATYVGPDGRVVRVRGTDVFQRI